VAYLNLDKLRKVYPNGTLAVQDMDLEIRQGEFIVFLGPSGCGKTTTLRMLAGLEQVTGGSIVLDGRDITDLAPRERNISMIFQSYAVWPHMTVAENIGYPLKLRKMKKPAIAAKVEHVAQVCGITDYLGRYPSQLSGGQRQRVAVARALAVESKLSLMDEPLSNLDAKLRVSVRTFLKEIHRESGATTIFVTHDQSEAMALADRIVVMNGGQIEQIGSTRDIYNRCDSLFTAQFMGTPPANIKNVALQIVGGRLIAGAEGKAGPVSLDLGRADAAPDIARLAGRGVCLAVRPEIIRIGSRAGINDVTIDIVEPQGAYTILVARILDSEWKVMVEGDPDLEPGLTVPLEVDASRIMLFDPESGRRL
jgi:multiple sugar transport system ATP-binding protein